MQKITLIGRPATLPQLRAGGVFAVPRHDGSTFGIVVAGTAAETHSWVCLADPDSDRRFRVVRQPRSDEVVFSLPAAGTVVEPQNLLPVAGTTLVPGMVAMTRTHLLLKIRGEAGDPGFVDLESGALVALPAEPAVIACRWQLVVLGHGDRPSPLFSVDVTP